MIVPQEIRNREFNRALNGYNQEEVVVFLQELSEEYEFQYSQNEKLKDSLRQLRSQIDMFKETEGKFDQVLHISNHKAAALGEQAEIEAKHILVHTDQRVNEILDLHREVIQRISAFSAETRSLLQEYRDFSEDNNPEYSGTEIPGEENGPPEMEQLRVRVDELLKGLNDDRGTYIPAAGREQVTIESLMSCLWGKTFTETLEEDEAILPNIPEQTERLTPLPIEPFPPVQPQVPREVPLPVTRKEMMHKAPNEEGRVPLPITRKGKQEKAVKVRWGWLAILALVMVLGLVGGYCWRHDLAPHIPWKQSMGSPLPPLLLVAMDQDADKVEQLLESGTSPDIAGSILPIKKC